MHPATGLPVASWSAERVTRWAGPGTTRAIRTACGICTHLGGVLEGNDADQSYDCPLHGSRFAPTGEVLEGPAIRALALRDDDHS